MKAIIMAGGFGTRLRPLTINLPKPMVPIGNLPMMEHVVSLLLASNITDITALVYFQADKIRDYFGDGSAFGVNLSYVQPDDDFGTAGAVRCALETVQEQVLVISGDLVTDFDLTEAITWHNEKGSLATLLLTRMENPLAYGIVITDENGRIVRFLEKPTWGEAFSDTINTGIYILEQSAIELIPPRTNFDFSQNLFPLMLSKQMALYGKTMKGYWKDVGNVEEYRLAHIDLFDDKFKLNLKTECKTSEQGDLFLGERVTMGEGVEFTGKVILGNDVAIESGCKLHNCAIGDRSRLGQSSELTNTTIWSDATIGAEAVMTNAIVGSSARLGENVQLLDDVIVSDSCEIGASATVKANCKIWPGKKVDAGAIVSTSMVWGEKWNRELFTDSKITGLALTEITPEMCVKVGAAFGALVGQGNAVVTSRDASDTSRLLKRSLISGLLAAGVHVSDLEMMPMPVVRYSLRQGNYSAGIYFRHNPQDYRIIDMIFVDGTGLDLPTSKSKRVARMYSGEDFERAALDDIGHLEMTEHVLEDYRDDFMGAIDRDMIRQAGFKVVIDHSNGASSQIFPTLFSNLGIESIELNANLDPRKVSGSLEHADQAIDQLSKIVISLQADIGFLLNPAAEKLTVIDEQGNAIDSQLLLLMVTDLFLRTNETKQLAVPVAASMGVEDLAEKHSVEVIRVPNDHLAMMEIKRSGKADFVGGTRGGFIFPGFQMGSDAMLSTVKVLEMMARTGTHLGDLRKQFGHLAWKSVSVPCPWSRKGTVMRHLITGTADRKRQLIDGVRIFEDNGWVLVAPDRQTAAFNILAESSSPEETERLIEQYTRFIEKSQADE